MNRQVSLNPLAAMAAKASPMKLAPTAIALAALLAGAAQAATIVYQNDFNSPVGWTDQSGNGTQISFAQVNSLYGSAFQQTFTVETIKLAGNANYSDPAGTGGAYTLGMLSAAQNDLLALTFNVGSLSFVNVMMDFAGMGPVACPSCGGPFGFAGQTPIFDLRLYDSPSGTFNLGSPVTQLSAAAMTGNVIASTTNLGWNNRTSALSTVGSTNGRVTVVFDLRAGAGMAGYAAFDNIVIASSDVSGDVGGGGGVAPAIPEPSTTALMGLGLLGLLGVAKRARRR